MGNFWCLLFYLIIRNLVLYQYIRISTHHFKCARVWAFSQTFCELLIYLWNWTYLSKQKYVSVVISRNVSDFTVSHVLIVLSLLIGAQCWISCGLFMTFYVCDFYAISSVFHFSPLFFCLISLFHLNFCLLTTLIFSAFLSHECLSFDVVTVLICLWLASMITSFCLPCHHQRRWEANTYCFPWIQCYSVDF